MKQYRIVKIVWADDLKTAFANEKKAEIVECVLNEGVSAPNSTLGFSK